MKIKRNRFVVTPAPGFKSLFIKKVPNRNKVCDCGSNKKYKKCCGKRRDDAISESVKDINKVIEKPGPAPEEQEPRHAMVYTVMALFIAILVTFLTHCT